MLSPVPFFAFLACLAISLCCPAQGTDQTPLAPTAIGVHSHNDYYQAKPLVTSLAAGVRSIEADVFLVEGEILVGHDPQELRPDRTLRNMYLEPLAERVQSLEGKVYPDQPEDQPLILLVDIKRDGVACIEALDAMLVEFDTMLTVVDDGQVRWGPIWIVISGDRPVRTIQELSPRRVAIDGRPEDLEGDAPFHLIPLISQRWSALFTWDALGEPSDLESKRITEIVSRAHAQDRLVRFWASPDHQQAWIRQHRIGVDLVNTDKPLACARAIRSLGDRRDSLHSD